MLFAGVDKVRIGRTDDPITPRFLWTSGSRVVLTMGAAFIVAFVSALAVGALAAYLAIAEGLPESIDLKAYRPKTVSVFYADDESVLGLFYNERRFPVALDTVPKHVQDAFVAAEDARFFSHIGIDPSGMMRALVKNLQVGNFAQGGSTITQQVARSILLTREKTISRKLREIILALRIERSNSKAQILETYLNEIYLGRGAYGIEAAAQSYFGKKSTDLTLSEAAYLAGLAASPSRFGPEHSDKAEARRQYVLTSMLKLQTISEAEYKKASEEKLALNPNAPDRGTNKSYFTEAVRRYVVSKYGEKALQEDGLRVWTTVNKDLQEKAEEAVLQGVAAWEQRHGRAAGLVKRLEPEEVQNMKSGQPEGNLKPGATGQAVVVAARESRKRTRDSGALYDVTVMMKGGATYEVQAESGVPYRKNDLLTFKVKDLADGKPVLEHDDLPPVQGALVSIENNTGYVKALVGGTGGDTAGFNRALQALRQPGSAFKPIIYAAALEWGNYDPRTVIVDEPIAVKADSTPEWIPDNPDGRFQGPLTVKDALVKSRNIPAVKVMMDLGPEAISQMARNLGIKSPIGGNLSSALGASEVTPMDLTAAYSVFPNMGVRITPILIKKITDQSGHVLEDNTVQPLDTAKRAKKDIEDGVCVRVPETVEAEQKQLKSQAGVAESNASCKAFEPDRPNMVRVMSPRAAYAMLSMLREVTVSGTASSVRRMGRPDVAGKTGTTNDYTDAWFVGFNPTYTTGVWIGYDARDSLGTKEFGAKAALPVWMEYMSYALRADKPRIWPPPPGIDFARSPSLRVAQDVQFKQISPVDVIPIPVSAGLTGYSMGWAPVPYGALSQYGMVRILSPRGKTVELASYAQDEKGNLVLQKLPALSFSPEGFGLGQ